MYLQNPKTQQLQKMWNPKCDFRSPKTNSISPSKLGTDQVSAVANGLQQSSSNKLADNQKNADS